MFFTQCCHVVINQDTICPCKYPPSDFLFSLRNFMVTFFLLLKLSIHVSLPSWNFVDPSVFVCLFVCFWELWIWVVFLTFPLLPHSNNCFVQAFYSPEVQIKFHLSVISLACWHLWVKAVKLSLLPRRGERMTRFISGSVPLTMWHMFWRFLQDFCPRRQFLSWQCIVLRGDGWMSCQ